MQVFFLGGGRAKIGGVGGEFGTGTFCYKVPCGSFLVDGCCSFLLGSGHCYVWMGYGWLLVLPGGFWMVTVIPWWVLDGHCYGGVFAQRALSARTAPTITVIIRVTAPKPPTCGIMHNQFKSRKFKHLMLAMGPRDLNSAPYSPVHCSSHSMTSFQSSELTELPVVENGQLFAQRAHSTCTARAQRTARPLFPMGSGT